jgi:hypothetical protein
MRAALDLILGLHPVGYNGSWKFDICNFETMLPYICNDIRKQISNYNIYKKSRISVLRSEETSKHYIFVIFVLNARNSGPAIPNSEISS